MRIVFRTDASVRMGTGHVMRCLTLAGELRRLGAEIHFLCRPHEGHLLGFIREQEGFPAHALEASDGSSDLIGPPHSAWLGTGWESDARQLAAILDREGLQPDWIVVDHYALDARWESALRPKSRRILVIDDLADRPHDCDALLDQNLYPSQASRYANLVPASCRMFIGPRYALLRREFTEARKTFTRKAGTIGRILVFFGGADPTDETGKALDAMESLKDLKGPEFLADIVVGASNPNRARIQARCLANPRFRFHFQVRNMAELTAAADLAIGAGGTTTWERCCLSLPTLCITIADNQRAVAQAAGAAGILRYLGHYDEVGAADLAQALSGYLSDPSPLVAMAALAGSLVDGSGAALAAEWMMDATSISESIRLRPASSEDGMTLFHWANDPDVRMNSFHPQPIPLDDHLRWFQSRLAKASTAIFILECGREPAGQIRFDADGKDAVEIDFSVDPRFRGRGFGKELLLRGIQAYAHRREANRVFRGTVKRVNAASAKAFLGAGFTQEKAALMHGVECLIFSRRAME